MNRSVLLAVFKRNLTAYFVSPLGYVFICVFVLLSAFAAFWSEDFFAKNLANLDQLTKYFPLVMLVFVPAITMSIWAEERRQGTDELLLTIPAGDFEIVLGKYLAAVAIFTISLLFSAICNAVVLAWLGSPDIGLFIATYFGYWFVGVAMLAVGMVASFLTSNLTVAFVLGAVFNAPLVFASKAELLFERELAQLIRRWGIDDQLASFGRGIVSLSGITYFLAIVVVMLYLSMILIGRRHLRTGRGVIANHVFYPLLHGLWLLSFLTMAVVLRRWMSPAAVISLLAVLYLVIQVGMVWGWQSLPRFGAGGGFARLPLAHAALLLLFVFALAIGNIRSTEDEPISNNVVISLFSIYVLAHLGLLWWWTVQPRNVTVTPGQYIVRALALAVMAIAVCGFFMQHDLRSDWTSEQLSRLSPDTKSLLKEIEGDRPIDIEAFLSPMAEMPDKYVQIRINLVSLLEELAANSGGKIRLQIHDTERFSEDAERARDRFGITSKEVSGEVRGTLREEPVFMGVAITRGLQRALIPFFDRGTPIEYELVRAVATVSQQDKKRVGVVKTDAPLFGEMDFQNPMSPPKDSPLLEELRKGCDVVRVDPAQPIKDSFDVMLVVQPSSLGPAELDNVIAKIQEGQPTAIFEDPMPVFTRAPATLDPKRGQSNPMMPQMPQQKGDINKLFSALEVNFSRLRKDSTPDMFAEDPMQMNQQGNCDIVWQQYNGIPKLADLSKRRPEFVFIDHSVARKGINEDDSITSHFQRLFFPFPGYVSSVGGTYDFVPLIETGDRTGTTPYTEVRRSLRSEDEESKQGSFTGTPYTLAARVRSKRLAGGEAGAAPRSGDINVIVVADIDLFSELFFRFRDQRELSEGIDVDFDNIAFVLNVLDDLAGDSRFIDIRKRRQTHRTLVQVDRVMERTRERAVKQRDDLLQKLKKAGEDHDKDLHAKVAELRKKLQTKKLKEAEAQEQIELYQDELQKSFRRRFAEIREGYLRDIEKAERDQQIELRRVQDRYKMWAVVLPPILPLAVAVFVFLRRRLREREGVSRSRLKS